MLPAACFAHPCQHVEASNLEDNSSITLLPMRYVLILHRGDWSVCVHEMWKSFLRRQQPTLEIDALLSCHQLIVAAWVWWPSNPLAIDLSCHLLIGYSLVLMTFDLARSHVVRYRCLRSYILCSCPSVRRLEIFAFAWIILFADSTSWLYLLPFHLGSWDICSAVRPIANWLRGS